MGIVATNLVRHSAVKASDLHLDARKRWFKAGVQHPRCWDAAGNLIDIDKTALPTRNGDHDFLHRQNQAWFLNKLQEFPLVGRVHVPNSVIAVPSPVVTDNAVMARLAPEVYFYAFKDKDLFAAAQIGGLIPGWPSEDYMQRNNILITLPHGAQGGSGPGGSGPVGVQQKQLVAQQQQMNQNQKQQQQQQLHAGMGAQPIIPDYAANICKFIDAQLPFPHICWLDQATEPRLSFQGNKDYIVANAGPRCELYAFKDMALANTTGLPWIIGWPPHLNQVVTPVKVEPKIDYAAITRQIIGR